MVYMILGKRDKRLLYLSGYGESGGSGFRRTLRFLRSSPPANTAGSS